MNLTQSAVSLHVKRLEDQVGSRLIVRNARGVGLTENGEVLLSYARRILALHKEAEHRLGRDSDAPIRIGAPDYFDFHILSSLLGQFAARHPAVRLQVELGIGPDISALLDEGELDLAIVSNEIGEGDGVALCRERRVWAAAQGDAARPFQRRRRSRYIRRTAAGGSSPWSNSIGPGGHGRWCCRAPARRASSPRSTPASASRSFRNMACRPTLKALGSAEALPALPDFEFVLRRSRNRSSAADHLAGMITSFFELSTALRPGIDYQERANLLL